MNKLLFLLLFSLFTSTAFPQKKNKHEIRLEEVNIVIDSLSQYYTVTEEGVLLSRVIQAPDYNKESLFVKVLEVTSSIYVDSKEVIQTQDKEEGIIFGKGHFQETKYDKISGAREICTIHHNLKIEVKDGRFKVSITLNKTELAYYMMNGVKAWEYNYNILNFYPFSQNIKLKHKDNSFNRIKFGITNALSVLDIFEQKTKKEETNDDW